MKMKKTALIIVALLTTAQLASALSIIGQEISNDVIFSYSGSVNTGGLSLQDPGISSFNTEIEPNNNEISASTEADGNSNTWTASDLMITGTMGTGIERSGTATGNSLGIFENSGDYLIVLSKNYESGTNITGTITFSNATFTTMGLTENNTVTYSWGSGGNADSITFSTVPEPSQSALYLAIASVVVAMTRQRRP